MSKNKAYKSGTVTVTVDYGYDVHTVELSGRTYTRVLTNQPLTIKGQGFQWEGEPDQDHWHFNEEQPGSILIDTDGGADIYSGYLEDDEVDVDIGDIPLKKDPPSPSR